MSHIEYITNSNFADAVPSRSRTGECGVRSVVDSATVCSQVFGPNTHRLFQFLIIDCSHKKMEK